MGTATLDFPHLTDTAKVRAEAASQYGELDNAASFIQAHKASLDPNVEAAQLKQINIEATEEVMADLEENGMDSLAQKKIDEAYGEGKYVVLAAAVRQHALTAVAESTTDGRTYKLVAGYTERWKPIVETPAQRSARVGQANEAAKGRLGAEARAEVERLVQKGLDKALGKVGEMLAQAKLDAGQVRSEAVAAASQAIETDDEGENETDETPVAAWPKTKADLKAIAAKHNVEVKNADTIAEMIGKLEAAEVAPPTE